MKLTLKEMNGLLNGKCLPSDLIIGETLAEYLVRKFAEADARCAALAAENAGMDSFVDALLSIAWQGGSADGAEIQELALKHGLLRQEVYSADEHETLVDDPDNFEDGDPVYFRVETPATDAFLAEVRAQHLQSYADSIAARMKDKSLSMRQKELLNFAWAEVKSYAAELHNAQLRKGVQS